MKIVAISDTHFSHSQLTVPDGDVLVHAGDCLGRGNIAELNHFNDWLGKLSHQHKIVIAGNHDFVFERNPQIAEQVMTNATYLRDSWVEIDDVVFYGSPWQPVFLNWAFNLPRNGPELEKKWSQIPSNTNILITHGPPYGILDVPAPPIPEKDRSSKGCEKLTEAIDDNQIMKPFIHIFGHIHGGYGHLEKDDVKYYNASVVNERYLVVNKPWVIEI